MLKIDTVIGHVETDIGVATLVATRLEDNHLEVHLAFCPSSLKVVLSWNPHRCDTAPDEFLMKESGVAAEFFDAVLASGLFVDTGRRVNRGFQSAPVWALKNLAHVPPLRKAKVCALLMPV
jgi:hypothetical protein